MNGMPVMENSRLLFSPCHVQLLISKIVDSRRSGPAYIVFHLQKISKSFKIAIFILLFTLIKTKRLIACLSNIRVNWISDILMLELNLKSGKPIKRHSVQVWHGGSFGDLCNFQFNTGTSSSVFLLEIQHSWTLK